MTGKKEQSMNSTWMMTVALAILPVWPVCAQDAQTVLSNVARAMGTEGLKTVEYSGSGFDNAFGQAFHPDLPWPKFNVKSYSRAIDFENPASRVHKIRTQFENPPRGGGRQPIEGEQMQNQVIVVNSTTPWEQQLEIWMTPQGFLKAAVAHNPTVKSRTMDGIRYTVVSFLGQNQAQVNGYVDDQNMIARVETWIDNPQLGDMLIEVTYTGYKDFGGVKFPTHILQKQGGSPILELTVEDVKPNDAVSIEAPPRGAPPAPRPVETKRLADGVFLVTGQYGSVAVEFKDSIMVIEAPGDEQRSLTVIEQVKKVIPNKPITYIVNTHQHFDHSSGLRTFVAEGATVVTHEINKPYYERIWKTPHTLNPDRLAQSPWEPTFETVAEKKILTDGSHVVELYHVQNELHNAGIIFAYLPKEKILVQADGFAIPARPDTPPPNPPAQNAVNLVANLERLNLDYDEIVSIHLPADGRKVTKADLMRAVGRN
jgi:glyoxylase-like metal-dependent hydrolase (beta-lactamase superfamily II)